MRSMNKICMSVLMLGAVAIAAPALAQAGDAKADASEQAAAPDQSATTAKTEANESANADSSAGPAAASTNTQAAMNSSNADAAAAANANVSSVGDTSKKYHRAARNKDFAAEQKITQQLNQQASAAAKPSVQTAMNQ